MFACQKLFCLWSSILCIRVVGDVVPFKDAPCAVTGDLHDDAFLNASPAQVSDCGSAQIVKK
jgi:hypothetical protein